MSTCVLPEGETRSVARATATLLVRAEGEQLCVARIVGDAVEWLGGR